MESSVYKFTDINSKNKFSFSCIYKLTSPSGKIYIGQTQCLYDRVRRYRGGIFNKYMKNAVNKYGSDNISIEILEKDVPLKKLDEREQFYLDTLQPFNDNGYNICKMAGTTRGRKRPPEEMKGLSDFNKTRLGELNHFYGKTHTEESKEKQRKAKLGKKLSQETIDKIVNNTDYAKKHKCVKQIDLITGKIIATFESITEAHNMTNVSMSGISSVANKRTHKRGEKEWLIKSAGGYYWEWCN